MTDQSEGVAASLQASPHDREGHPDDARGHGRRPGRGVPEGREPPDAGPPQPPGDGSSIDWSAAILKKKEGFIPRAKWDVNHERLGYGSDTITRADGSIHEVQRGDTVTREDADRDLKRRMPEFQGTLRKQVGAANWDRLDPATQGALTSLGYNYGSFVPPRNKPDYMKPLRDAIATGDKTKIAAAVRAMQGHNHGINRQRRIEEAGIIESGHLPQSWHTRDPATALARHAPPGAPVPPVAEARHPAAPGPVAPRRTAARSPAAPAPVRMATGGRVVGPGGPREDRVPAMLSHGEFVITAAAAAKHPGLLDDINGDRIAARSARSAPLSARFAEPGGVPSAPRAAEVGTASGGAPAAGAAPAAGPPAIQNFYGMHDPAVTARRAMLEGNREVRRAQARALHSVGRVA